MVINNINNKENSDYLEFQISDWNSYHEIDHEDEDKYVVQLFGRTLDDKDVCLKVCNYTPYFYVQIPVTWNKTQINKFIDGLKSQVKSYCGNKPEYDYDMDKSLIMYTLVQKHDFMNFRNKKLFNFVMLVFKSHVGMREFSNMLSRPIKISDLTRYPVQYKRYESNIEPHIRLMHANNLSSCGWVSIDKTTLKENREYSNCDYSYSVDWKYVKPANNDDRMAPFKIMGYDIECISCDHNFCQADRKTDEIIQIGITMYRYGSLQCYEQHILTLKGCSKIKGVNVECYLTEKGLIRGFAKKISEIRPDFKAGYNNFGFDDKYIFDRINRIDKEEAEKQGIKVNDLENRFLDEILQIIGKVNNKYIMENEGVKKSLTYFEIKNLSSSALGDNELKFIQVPGIISVDMMKVIQRDHRLIGYKLDNVSANFITEKAIKFIEGDIIDKDYEIKSDIDDDELFDISIYTGSTKALDRKSYVQIMIDDGYSSTPLCEGAKYKVYDITTVVEKKYNEKDKKHDIFTYQAIKTKIKYGEIKQLREILINPLLKICWTFAKDDMHHTIINKNFAEGNKRKIRQIAKYCLKDCKLVNLLLAKLEIIVNSIGMAKVCHVPLSYLFLRGQGVKIFSLVSKKCREKNFLIPVLRRKKKDNNGDEEDSYEGATVITPKPNVYLSPIGVLDYSSLYPNSMRERNLSSECYVDNEAYNNLPGYVYHDIEIILKNKKGKILRNIDGTPQKEYHRFAQEIITEEQIAKELSDVINKINNKCNTNISIIEQQKYLTADNINDIITKYKTITENEIENVENEENLSEKKKIKLIEAHKYKLDIIINKYKDADREIKIHKENLKSQLDSIDKSLSVEEKTEITNNYKFENEKLINKILKTINYTQKDIEELINIENDKAKRSINAERAKIYNVVNGKTVRYGILPEILTELLNKRKETNGRLAVEKDPFVKAILNALQLAFKVTANSLYGQTGAPTSPLYFLPIAACTTAIGRERLYYAKKTVEENFPGSEVIYGDSVTGDTPLIIKHNNSEDIEITTIQNLSNSWKKYEEFKAGESNRKLKQQALVDYQVWTDNGWAKIKRIIRHQTSKKIYRVLTHTGCVDVTEDHSLLDKNKNIIKPIDCVIGTELLHGFPEPNNIHENISIQRAYDLGYSSNFNSKNLFNEPEFIMILNSSVKIKQSFIDGWIKAGYFNINSKIHCQYLYYILKCLQYDVSVQILTSENFTGSATFRLKFSKILNTDNKISIREITYLRDTYDGEFVYDLETESGTFHAGIGELIVKNTDSIFINFHIKDKSGQEITDKEALMKTIIKCQRAAKLINENVPKPQSIVYEKTLHPLILVTRKKYVGLLFEKNPDKYFLKAMGIVLKRRDNPPIVKIVIGGIIDFILKHRDIEKAVEYTINVIQKLMNGDYPIDKFIFSKTLRAKYKAKGNKPSSVAHKMLADRMAERDPGNKPQINDRIPFVYVVKNFAGKKPKDILQGDLIEHPDYVIKHGLKIDYLYYLEHQIINPATQILELMLDSKSVKKIFDKFIIEENNKRKGAQSIEKWSSKQTYAGSKTSKPVISLKSTKSSRPQEKYDNLVKIKKNTRHECRDISGWLDFSNPKYKGILTQKTKQTEIIKPPKVDDRYIGLMKVKKSDNHECKKLDVFFNSKEPESINSGNWNLEI
ncbi:DNA polymerase family B [Cotonvirus japonicus]|uniref:DNA-directed DNA polymerase n=1 Tax=Cotonvirus japonicus TaxID=2811091 RepID=A0ABM7NSX8_9VIRU|nr:DNA polymerase family B [Cotonvirus japonicus]BCS83263.1 DNA polymerase family B [Cotonvirus japonicus]